ncbi:MAG: hypothetical protein IKC69_03820 [Clostridia bacterium]|nr:hypothetical protein [Clostridia bacterium]
MLKLSDLKGAFSSAADVNRDGVVDAIDLLIIRKHLLKLNPIDQGD